MRPVERIEFGAANRICQALLPLGDAAWQLGRQLQDRGFCAYLPYHEFIESFGNADEITLHRLCLREEAKRRLGRPWPFRLTSEQASQTYSSALLSGLRAALYSEYGVGSESELNIKYPGEVWRNVVDPCERKKMLAAQQEGMNFELRCQAVRDRIAAIVAAEAQREAKRRTMRPHFDVRGRVEYYKILMGEKAGDLGFQYDPRQSKGAYIVFAKPVLGDWSLCFILEDSKKLYRDPFSGLYEPKLMLRHNSLKGDPGVGTLGRFLTLDYANIVFGFSNSYWEFHDSDELELHIATHLFMYGLCSEAVEAATRSGLAS